MLYHSSLELIGNTPLVELTRIKIPNNNRIFAKLEGQNPAGGVKDRVALFALSKLREEGKLHKNSVVVEATAGNTGLGIAFVALHFGIGAILVVPEKFSIEKQKLMRALGAEIISTPREEGMQGAVKVAQKILAENPNAISLNQFENPHNPQAHYESTAREIYADMGGARASESRRNSEIKACHSEGYQLEESQKANRQSIKDSESTQSGTNDKCSSISQIGQDSESAQTSTAEGFSMNFKGYQAGGEGSLLGVSERAESADSLKSRENQQPRLDYFICGAGSGGSFSGISRYLKEQDNRIQCVLCDPIGSIIGGGVEGCANIEGIGNSFIPQTMDISLIDRVEKISDEEAYHGLRILAREEGILAGISSGACLIAALKVAATCQNSLIVTLFADDLSRYLSRDLV